MTKKSLISFTEYQESLLEKGMAIAAECTHQSFGGIIFNQVIKNPSGDLLRSMRDKACEVLADKMQEHHRNSKSYGPSDDEYTQRLVDEFEDEQESRTFPKEPELEWIDGENPRSGILARVDKDMWSYFDLRVNPSRLKAIWEKELGSEIDTNTDMNVQDEIDYLLNYGYLPYKEHYNWDEMIPLAEVVFNCCRTPTIYKRINSLFMTKMSSPVFGNYKNHLFYVAAEDTAYFVIGRPYFYPIIAGERSDGSHEITIFEALNEC